MQKTAKKNLAQFAQRLNENQLINKDRTSTLKGGGGGVIVDLML